MSELGWVEPAPGEPGLVVTGQAVQGGAAGAAQAVITEAAPGDVASAPEQVPADQATAYVTPTP